MATNTSKPNLVNLLPPGSQNSEMYCIIDVLPPASYGAQASATSSYYLHIPKELNNIFAANWEQKELGSDTLSAILTGSGFTGGGTGADNGALSTGLVKSVATDIVQGLGIGAGAAEAARAGAGIAKNPVNALLFQNMNLRNFQFSWDLIPLDPQTSKAYEKMIADIRLKMHPRLDSNATYVFPHSFRFKLMVKGKMLINTLPCAITNLTINSFGSGVPAFHADGTAVHTVFTLEMQELTTQTQKSIEYLYKKG